MRRAMPARISATRLVVIGGAMALGLIGSPAWSADVEYGRHLSAECATCHGASKSDSTIPDIHGLGEAHFVEVLRAYRAKALPNPVMQSIAVRLGDEEISALAAYFATAKKPK